MTGVGFSMRPGPRGSGMRVNGEPLVVYIERVFAGEARGRIMAVNTGAKQ